MISQNERERELYESRLKMRRDISSAITEAEEKGERKGQIARMQSFQRLLREDVTPREDLQARTLWELERFAAQLEHQLNAKLGNGS